MTLLLDRGANPNIIGAGYTALHAAILRGNLDVVKALVSRGANVNSRLRNGTPRLDQDLSVLGRDFSGAAHELVD